MRRRIAWIVGGLGIAAIAAFHLWGPPHYAEETSIVPIPLAGGPERPEAEISGLAWRDDELVLLPQYPRRFGGALFVAERSAIEAAIDSGATVFVRSVPLVAPGLEERLPRFDGYEAIAFAGDDVYLSAETRGESDHVAGYLVRGRAEGRPLERVVVDVTRHAPLVAQIDRPNIGYEALTIDGARVLALYEANGEVNPRPRALAFARDLTPLGALPVTHIEYRVTDATNTDAHHRFWVMNYHWPGSPWLAASCRLTERFGQGETHARCHAVERLIELEATPSRVITTDRAPILLSLVDDAHARNWEGLVRLPGRGFLLMTDEHPASILAFVPGP